MFESQYNDEMEAEVKRLEAHNPSACMRHDDPHVCSATVRAAFDLGLTCTIAQDACATRDLTFNSEIIPARQVHGAFLAALGAVYANVRTTDAILDNIALH